ncbi:hypothetical protein Drorol1_Dr00021275 [Drosera rotundifolia]
MAEKKVIDIELYEAAASTQNDTAADDKLVALLKSRRIPDQEIMSYKTPSLNTLLHIASVKGNLSVVSCILRLHRGSISAKNLKLETALHLAARFGYGEVVEALLGRMKEKQDTTMLTTTDERGNTAAHGAVLNRHHQTVQALMKYDPGVSSYSKNEVLTILNDEGESPLYIAVKEGKNVELVKSMLDRLDLADKGKLMEAGKPLLYPAIMAKNKELSISVPKCKKEEMRE